MVQLFTSLNADIHQNLNENDELIFSSAFDLLS